jgi:sulfoxide reductase catalytic subunit YedY
MRVRSFDEPPGREITPPELYLRRRDFLRQAVLAGTAAALVPGVACGADAPRGEPIPGVVPGPFRTDEELTRFEDASSYNNFYELGTDKGDPVRNAHHLRTRPWSVAVEGEVAKPGALGIEEILKSFTLEERVYRLRCVEAWSMVIPWVGFPLGELLKRFEPTSQAKYVAFQTLLDPERLPGQRRSVLDWPYVEGLRLDEALHPLTILAVGMYGQVLPNQNGAPLRPGRPPAGTCRRRRSTASTRT